MRRVTPKKEIKKCTNDMLEMSGLARLVKGLHEHYQALSSASFRELPMVYTTEGHSIEMSYIHDLYSRYIRNYLQQVWLKLHRKFSGL